MSDAVLSIDPANIRRASRMAAQSWLWRRSKIESVRRCGRVPIVREGERQGVELRVTVGADGKRHAGVSGVATCGSVWACPVCSAKIAAKRADLVNGILRGWRARGGRVVMATFTVRHHRKQSLATIWDGVKLAWQRATGGSGWVEDQETYGTWLDLGRGERDRIPVVRFTETTYTSNGWHCHVHALLLVNGSVTMGDAENLGRRMWERWDKGAQTACLRAGVLEAHECHLVHPDGDAPLADYFAKAVYETTLGSQTKQGAEGSLTPFGVLASIMEYRAGAADFDDAEYRRLRAIWSEWEADSRGRRQMGITPGLAALVGLGDEADRTDEDLAGEEMGTSADTVSLIGHKLWGRICSSGLRSKLYEAWEAGPERGAEFLAWAERFSRFISWSKLQT